VVSTLKEAQKKNKQQQSSARVLPPKFYIPSAEDYSHLKDRCIMFLCKTPRLVTSQQQSRFKEFMDHLILLTLVSVAPPRKQVFALMEPRHLIWKEDQKSYEIHLDGADPPLKTKKPVFLVLPSDVSAHYKVWLETIRALYLLTPVSKFVFPNAHGNSHKKLTDGIKALTCRYLKQAVPMSKFR
jgi:hypothetical protein